MLTFKASKHYLNSSPRASKSTFVYLNDSIDFTKNPGCHWKYVKQGLGNGTYCMLSYPWTETSKCYLDSTTLASKDESVYLADSSAGRKFILDAD